MARGEIFDARVERLAAGGAGIARLEGKSVFIELTAPGDLVRCRLKNERKSWAEGEVLELREPSPLRVAPLCPLYGRCGGCSLQHLGYEAQLEAKTAILREVFARIGRIDAPEIRVRRSEPFEYRNRVRFHRIERSRLGFKEKHSSTLVACDDCPVAESEIRKALKEGRLRLPPDKESFTVYSRGNTFLSSGETEKGRVSILGKELAMDVNVFFQSNAAMLELLITDLLKLSSGGDRNLPLADLYCGVGTFAAFLGAGFPEIDLLEENKAALALAAENMPRGKKLNYYALSDTNWVKTVKKQSWGFMVLDPPREGLSKALSGWLAFNGPELAAYVSCDPATLARDSRILINGGYLLKELNLYDFYPQTAHIESLAVFSRKGRENEKS